MIYETDTQQVQIYVSSAWVPYGNVIICTSSTRPSTPFEGMQIYETDTDDTQTYTGSAWVVTGSSGGWNTYTPTLTVFSGTNPTLGSGSVQSGYYKITNKVVTANALIKFGTSGVSAGSGSYYFGRPVGGANRIQFEACGYGWIFDNSTSAYRVVTLSFDNLGARMVYGGTTTGGLVSNSTPWTWAASDQLYANFVYELA